MNIEKLSIEDIKSNPNNPRVIKNDKYKKLAVVISLTGYSSDGEQYERF